MTTFKKEPTSSPKTRAIGMTAPGAISIVMLPPKNVSTRLYVIWSSGDPLATAIAADARTRAT